MKPATKTLFISLFFIGACTTNAMMPQEEYNNLKEEKVNVDVDTGKYILADVREKNNAGYKLLLHLGKHDKFVTDEYSPKTYKYKINGNVPNTQITRTYSEYRRDQYGNKFYSQRTVKIDEDKFFNNFETLRELCTEAIKSKRLAIMVGIIAASLFAEYQCYRANPETVGAKLQFSFASFGATLTSWASYLLSKKLNFYDKIKEDKYLEQREKNNFDEEYDSLEREVPNSITSASVIRAIVLATVAGVATYFARSGQLKTIQSTTTN